MTLQYLHVTVSVFSDCFQGVVTDNTALLLLYLDSNTVSLNNVVHVKLTCSMSSLASRMVDSFVLKYFVSSKTLIVTPENIASSTFYFVNKLFPQG